LCKCNFTQCFNNGTFDESECKCICQEPFYGEMCETRRKECNEFQCQNGGEFNKEKCICDCFSTYAGERCEKVICNQDPNDCNYSIQYCDISIVKDYCPTLCGKCRNIIENNCTQEHINCEEIKKTENQTIISEACSDDEIR
jgi:hypothetical protein